MILGPAVSAHDHFGFTSVLPLPPVRHLDEDVLEDALGVNVHLCYTLHHRPLALIAETEEVGLKRAAL